MTNDPAPEVPPHDQTPGSSVEFVAGEIPDPEHDEDLTFGKSVQRTRLWWFAVPAAVVAGLLVGRLSAGTDRVSAGAHRPVPAASAGRTTSTARHIVISHDIVVPPPLLRLVKLDFPDALTTTLVTADGATAAQRRMQLIAELSRGLMLTVTATMDAQGGTGVHVSLAPVVVAQPGIGVFYCGWCGHIAHHAGPVAERVTRELDRVQPHLIALLGAGLNAALRQTK